MAVYLVVSRTWLDRKWFVVFEKNFLNPYKLIFDKMKFKKSQIIAETLL